MPSTRKAIFVVAAIAVLGGLVYFLVPSRPETGGSISIPDGAGQAPSSQRTDRTAAAAIRPRTVAESEPAEGAASSRGALEIEVIGPAGKPAAKARLVLRREQETLGVATTDARGLAFFRSGEGDARLVVLPDGAPMHGTTIPIEPGRRRVQLPPGVSISGRVAVTGETPREPVTFRLFGDSQLANEVWTALRGEASATCTATESGSFEFEGVVTGSEWRLGPSVGYRVGEILREGRPVYAITAPAAGVIVNLVRLPIVRGRVVSEDRRTPLSGASCSVVWMNPTMSMSRLLKVDEDGTFRFSVAGATDEFERIEVTAIAPKRVGHRVVVLEPPPEHDHDLGDLGVSDGRVLRYLVQDRSGNPIEGAFASPGGDVDRSTKTDATGRGAITISDEVESIRIAALKFDLVEVPVPSPLPDVLPVVLAPNAGLEVSLTGQQAVPRALRVRMSAQSEDALAGGRPAHDPLHLAAGASVDENGSVDSRGTISSFVPDASGRVVIAGLKPGIPIALDAIDALGGVHASTSVTLGPGEWKTVALEVTRAPRALSGLVRDEAGKPVAGARIEIDAESADAGKHPGRMGGDAGQMFATTDASGRFAVGAIYTDAVFVVVRKAGYAVLGRHGVKAATDGAEIELVLRKGCRLTVTCVDTRGSPIKDVQVEADVAGFPWTHASQNAPGVYVFADFPIGVTATVTVQWADREFTRTFSVSGDQNETITLPAMGTVVIDYSVIVSPAPELFAVTLRSVPEGHTFGRTLGTPRPDSTAPRELEISPVPPGEYTITVERAEPPHPEIAPARVTVRAGETVRVKLEKPR